MITCLVEAGNLKTRWFFHAPQVDNAYLESGRPANFDVSMRDSQDDHLSGQSCMLTTLTELLPKQGEINYKARRTVWTANMLILILLWKLLEASFVLSLFNRIDSGSTQP